MATPLDGLTNNKNIQLIQSLHHNHLIVLLLFVRDEQQDTAARLVNSLWVQAVTCYQRAKNALVRKLEPVFADEFTCMKLLH